MNMDMESGFDKNSSSFSLKNQDSGRRIDFNLATQLKTGGSTCDTYIARVNGRLLFVKRLKEEYRHKPIFLNALQKEFEVGAFLRHKSLPVYLEYDEDYISLDYIDGKPLSEMIANNDPWLADEKNVKKLLEELLDVVAYLHDKNVIHCDIKPDNIMLTYGSNNLFLIILINVIRVGLTIHPAPLKNMVLVKIQRKTPKWISGGLANCWKPWKIM